MSVNQITFSGKLAEDPKTRTAGQHKIAEMALAVEDRGSKGKETTVSFFNLIAWNKTAEIVVENFVKGSTFSFLGHAKQERFETKDGKKVSNVKFVVDQVLNIPARINQSREPVYQEQKQSF